MESCSRRLIAPSRQSEMSSATEITLKPLAMKEQDESETVPLSLIPETPHLFKRPHKLNGKPRRTGCPGLRCAAPTPYVCPGRATSSCPQCCSSTRRVQLRQLKLREPDTPNSWEDRTVCSHTGCKCKNQHFEQGTTTAMQFDSGLLRLRRCDGHGAAVALRFPSESSSLRRSTDIRSDPLITKRKPQTRLTFLRILVPKIASRS